jgi:predicted metal-dependent hydrolase
MLVRMTKHVGKTMTGHTPMVRFINAKNPIARCTLTQSQRYIITYSRPWIQANQDNPLFIRGLMVHELAHILCPNHGEGWKTLCARWGARFETSHQRDACYAFKRP